MQDYVQKLLDITKYGYKLYETKSPYTIYINNEYKEFGCKLQIGGSDQWGNILAGADLSRKIGFSEGKKIFCFSNITRT